MFKEHEQIVLTAKILGDDGRELKPGDVGSVVHLHTNPAPGGFVAEFMDRDGETVTIATVLYSQARRKRAGSTGFKVSGKMRQTRRSARAASPP